MSPIGRRAGLALATPLALAALLALGGCGGSGAPAATSSKEPAKVTGKVSQKGKPLAKIEVKFNPANVNRKEAPMVSATTGADGSYEITSLVGDNTVTLGGAAMAKNPKAVYFSKTVDLKPGDNTVDLDVP